MTDSFPPERLHDALKESARSGPFHRLRTRREKRAMRRLIRHEADRGRLTSWGQVYVIHYDLRRNTIGPIPELGFSQPALFLGQSSGLDAIAPPDLLDGDREVIPNGAFREPQPGRDIGDRRAVHGG